MTGHYGSGVIEELNELRTSLHKITDEELRQTLALYRLML
jgi:hypothetical protein